jgi:hypothetical protein
MKRKYFNIIIFGIIGVMILFNAILLIHIANIPSPPTKQNSHDEQQDIKAIYHMLYRNVLIQYQSENNIINNIWGYVKQDEKVDLKSLLSDSLTLIFRYNENNCNICVEEALKPLMEYSAKIGIKNILIITSYRNIRTMQIFIRKYAPGIHVFNSNEDINLPIEKWSTPYFFLIDNTLKVQLVFIPIKEIQNYTREYLNIVNQQFLKKEVIEISSNPIVTTVESVQVEIELTDLQIDKTVEAIFSLKNTGNQPLIIQMVNASCGCTIPEWDKQPVKTGKSAKIKVRITPEEKGYFNKTITVHCNTEEGQISLKVKGMVKE